MNTVNVNSILFSLYFLLKCRINSCLAWFSELSRIILELWALFILHTKSVSISSLQLSWSRTVLYLYICCIIFSFLFLSKEKIRKLNNWNDVARCMHYKISNLISCFLALSLRLSFLNYTIIRKVYQYNCNV